MPIGLILPAKACHFSLTRLSQKEVNFHKTPVARCTMYNGKQCTCHCTSFLQLSLPRKPSPDHTFPQPDFTGIFLLFTCISSENSKSDNRLNARRFNSTFTALSATFTHFVAIIDVSHINKSPIGFLFIVATHWSFGCV